MSIFNGEIGLQFTTHLASSYSVRDWVELARLAQKSHFDQVWVNDNLGHRNIFVLLTAIASKIPIKLGTAILVPYFRNPVDTADALASLSELMDGREISVGIARGDYAQAGHQVRMEKPLAIVRETVEMLKLLFEGRSAHYSEFPALSAFYNLQQAAKIRLGFSPKSPILFYSGGNGPKIMEIAGRVMDGVLIGGFFISLVRAGKLAAVLEKAERGRLERQPNRKLRKVCEINISVSHDYEKAREFPKRYITHMLMVLDAMGFTADEFSSLGVNPGAVRNIKQMFEEGKTIEEAASLVTDGMVDAGFIAGKPKDCIEKVEEMCTHAANYGFDQVCFAKLGPDYNEAIEILGNELLPGIGLR